MLNLGVKAHVNTDGTISGLFAVASPTWSVNGYTTHVKVWSDSLGIYATLTANVAYRLSSTSHPLAAVAILDVYVMTNGTISADIEVDDLYGHVLAVSGPDDPDGTPKNLSMMSGTTYILPY